MADPLLERFTQEVVTERELKKLRPDWPDTLIRDYLSFKRNVFITAEVVEGVEGRLDAIELRLDLLEARVTYLEGLTVVTAIDYTIDGTTTGHQTIVCTAEVTVDLDPSPADRDTATIKAGQKNTRVIIDGNGKLIEADTTMTLRRLNTSRQIAMDLEYSEELDRWFTT